MKVAAVECWNASRPKRTEEALVISFLTVSDFNGVPYNAFTDTLTASEECNEFEGSNVTTLRLTAILCVFAILSCVPDEAFVFPGPVDEIGINSVFQIRDAEVPCLEDSVKLFLAFCDAVIESGKFADGVKSTLRCCPSSNRVAFPAGLIMKSLLSILFSVFDVKMTLLTDNCSCLDTVNITGVLVSWPCEIYKDEVFRSWYDFVIIMVWLTSRLGVGSVLHLRKDNSASAVVCCEILIEAGSTLVAFKSRDKYC